MAKLMDIHQRYTRAEVSVRVILSSEPAVALTALEYGLTPICYAVDICHATFLIVPPDSETMPQSRDQETHPQPFLCVSRLGGQPRPRNSS